MGPAFLFTNAHPHKRAQRRSCQQKRHNARPRPIRRRHRFIMRKAVALAPRIRVPLAGSTGTIGHRGLSGLFNQQGRNRSQDIHLLTHPVTAVVLLFFPAKPAHAAVLFAGARLDSGCGRGLEHGQDNGSRMRRDLCGDG